MPRFVDISGPVTAAAEVKAAINADFYVHVSDHGAVGDGVTDDTVALQSAVDAVPDGGTLFIPAGSYKITETLSSTGKSLHIQGQGATLVQSASVNVLSINGEWGTIYSVSGLADTTEVDGAESSLFCTDVTLSSAPSGIAKGDIVRLIADDVILGDRPTDGTAKSRVGQFFTVFDVDGTTVTLVGRPLDSYTTNIRLVKLERKTASVTGLRIESADAVTYAGAGITFYGLYAPVADMSFGPLATPACTFRGCFAPRADITVDRLDNVPSTGRIGYGLYDASSEHGQYKVVAGNVRHAYSDGSPQIEAGDTRPGYYGRPYGHRITGHAYGTAAQAFSPHSSGRQITFDSISATNCHGLVGLRGTDCRVLNAVAENCNYALIVLDEEDFNVGMDSGDMSDAWSEGHVIDGLTVKNPRVPPSTASIRLEANKYDGPTVGDRVSRPTILRNVVVDGAQDAVVNVTNRTVVIENMHVTAAASITNSSSLINTNNADLTVRNLVADYRANTAGTTLRLFKDGLLPPGVDTAVASSITASDVRWLYQSGTETRINAVCLGIVDETTWDVRDTEISYSCTVLNTDGAASGSTIDVVDADSGTSTAWVFAQNADIASTDFPVEISRSRAATVIARCFIDDTTRRDVAKLADGHFHGQRLVFINSNSSDNSVRVLHSVASRNVYNLVANTKIVLLPGMIAEWIWDQAGYWVQIANTVGCQVFSGTGSPEGVVEASVGSLYTNISGGANTTLYVKESGTSNTGWVAK